MGAPVGRTAVIRSRRTVAGQGGLTISESIKYGDHPPQKSERPPRQNANPGNSRFHGFGLSEFQGTPQTSPVSSEGGRFWTCSGNRNGPASRTRIDRKSTRLNSSHSSIS